MSTVAEIVESRELITNLTLRELRGRYKRSILGWTWSLLNPLSTVVIYSIVFGVLLDAPTTLGDPSGTENFTVWLLCGLLPWTFFSGSLNGSMGVLTGNAGLIRKVYFPREGLVLSFVASMLVTFVIEMLVLFVILVFFGNNFWPWLPLVALLMAIQTVFVTGFARALSVLNVYFRDIQYLVGAILLQAWFFLTPIVYPVKVETVSAKASKSVARLYTWNPMVRFVETYRDLLYDNRGPTLVNTVYLIAVASIVLVIGMKVFRRYESRLAEELWLGTAITVDGVSKRYRLYQERNTSLKATVLRRRRAVFKDLWALQDVSFEIQEGQTFGLIGHNGSGKSTMLKCIAKILRPNQGSITTNGKISALLELGAGFHPELSGRDNVYLNGSILGLPRKEIDRRFDSIVEFSGLEDRIDTPVKNYSSGMYIRLGFSVAINVDPDILLVDEILTVGDESFQRKCAQKFDDLKDAGKTIVIVSHGLGSVKELCDEVALLDHGHLVSVGKPDDVIDTYLGGVEKDVRPDGEHGMRFGRGGAIVDRVEMLDRQGKPVTSVHTGDNLVFRWHCRADERIEQPVFRLEFHNTHGMVIGAANTRYHSLPVDAIEGSFVVDYEIDHLMLVPGAYDISATIFDYDHKDPYDVRHRFQRLYVEFGSPPDIDGFVSLGGRWIGDVFTPKPTS